MTTAEPASRRINIKKWLTISAVVLVDTSAFHKHGPSRFDVVALQPPGIAGLAVKRVIGVPGDRVQIRTVDGQPQMLVQPAGKYFVLGDNPAASEDSRKFGFVDRSAIVGRVTFRIWSPGGIGGRPELVQLR